MSLRSSVVSNIIFEAVVFAWNTPNEAERELLLSSVDILGKAETIDVQTLRYALEHCDAREDTRLSVVNSCLPVLRRVFEVRQRAWNVNPEYGSGVNDWQWQRYVEPIDAALARIRRDLTTPGNLKDDLRELVEAAQTMLSWETSPDVGIPESSSVVMSLWPCFAWGVSLHQLGDAASTLDDVLSSIGDAEMFVTGSDCIPRPITIPYGMCEYIQQWEFGSSICTLCESSNPAYELCTDNDRHGSLFACTPCMLRHKIQQRSDSCPWSVRVYVMGEEREISRVKWISR